MSSEREPNQRRSLRLQDYNYAQASVYFITLCAHQRQSLFGTVCEGRMQEAPAGGMIEDNWRALPARFPFVELDDFVIMPNHFHGLLQIKLNAGLAGAGLAGAGLAGAGLAGAGLAGAEPDQEGRTRQEGRTQGSPLQSLATPYVHPTGTEGGSLGRVVQAFKSLTTHSYIAGVKQHGWPAFNGKIWQRDYYDHIVRNEAALNTIRRYIADNPLQWEQDEENPCNIDGHDDKP